MSERVYSWLLRLYPRDFRREYGDAMRQAFRDRARREPPLRLWFDILRDLALSLPVEYRRNRSCAMPARSLNFAPLLLPLTFGAAASMGAGVPMLVAALLFGSIALLSALGRHRNAAHSGVQGSIRTAPLTRAHALAPWVVTALLVCLGALIGRLLR